MKDMGPSLSKTVQRCIWSLVTIFMFSFCHKDPKENGDCDELVKNTEIDTTFEKYPPITQNIEVEILQTPLNSGENLRAVVEFENSDLEGKFLALNVGDVKIALRDDGKGADEKAKDGRFSIFIKEDIELLTEELDRQKEMILSK